MKVKTTAARGELWWAYLDPVVGSEQGGRRPVLVVSRDEYNDSAVGRVVIVAVTSSDRGWPTSVAIDASCGLGRASWALADQIRAIDNQRLRRRIGVVDAETMAGVEDVIRRLLYA